MNIQFNFEIDAQESFQTGSFNNDRGEVSVSDMMQVYYIQNDMITKVESCMIYFDVLNAYIG